MSHGIEISQVGKIRVVKIDGAHGGTVVLVCGGWIYYQGGEAIAVGTTVDSAVRAALVNRD